MNRGKPSFYLCIDCFGGGFWVKIEIPLGLWNGLDGRDVGCME